MAQRPIGLFPRSGKSIAAELPTFRNNDFFNVSDAELFSLIDTPQVGEFKREMITWRTPHLGFVKMYINPQSLVISDKKDITSVRTKGGFLMQYAGESLTSISLDGTTGSSGIEGINILRSIYRSEQEAFNQVALALEERLTAAQTETFTANVTDNVTGLVGFSVTPNSVQISNDFLKLFGQPQPTLASLAAGLEMFYQGVLYKGYFENFKVTESGASPGLFTYGLNFKAYARQGIRRNFMPWHRQPINPANTNSNPLSFSDLANSAPNSKGNTSTFPGFPVEAASPFPDTFPNIGQPIPTGTRAKERLQLATQGGPKRYTASGRDSQGKALSVTGSNKSVS